MLALARTPAASPAFALCTAALATALVPCSAAATCTALAAATCTALASYRTFGTRLPTASASATAFVLGDVLLEFHI